MSLLNRGVKSFSYCLPSSSPSCATCVRSSFSSSHTSDRCASGFAVVRHRTAGLTKWGLRRRLSSARGDAEAPLDVTAAAEGAPTRSQLLKLCAVSSVPFIGFGIADNAIMILAGDAIDETFGAALGMSTLAAAGFGNLCSDVVGVGAGDAIERTCHRLGLREPPLSATQNAMGITRRTRTLASVLGISVGCLIGMTPILFLIDRKKMYFNEKELSLYETVFQPFGVSSPDFFELMRHSKWKTADRGTVIVQAGTIFDKVIMVHNGSAEAFGRKADGSMTASSNPIEMLYRYRGRTGKECLVIGPRASDSSALEEAHMNIRGSIIGGTALVDIAEATKHPYPNTVIATGRCDYVEWSMAELKGQMSQNKAVEAAVFSTL